MVDLGFVGPSRPANDSNRSAAGEREDSSGPALVEALRGAGFDVAPEALVVADDEDAHRASAVQWFQYK